MTPKELKQLVKTMRGLGVTSLKDGALELTITQSAPAKAKPQDISDDKIKHTVENMQSVMRLGDAQLMEMLFPDTVCYDDGVDEATK